ncbi:MAG: transcriptional regulator NrdR [Candidatus Micrarchaeia archaeon]
MRCPYCFSEDVAVVDSRYVEATNSIRRRRMCNACKRRFTTYETIVKMGITVIKHDNTREPFNKDKIIVGMEKACEKRPVSHEQIEAIADKIERKIIASGVAEVKSSRIGEMVIRELLKIDPVAYIRFASVYNNFNSPSEFRKIAMLVQKGRRDRTLPG